LFGGWKNPWKTREMVTTFGFPNGFGGKRVGNLWIFGKCQVDTLMLMTQPETSPIFAKERSLKRVLR